MPLILLLAIALILPQSVRLIEPLPFRVEVVYMPDASVTEASMEVYAAWADLGIREVSIRNHTSMVAYELDPQAEGPWTLDGNALSVRLLDLFPGAGLHAGPNLFSVSLRAENGVRTIVEGIEVNIQ